MKRNIKYSNKIGKDDYKNRVPTGIKGFDSLIEGGFKKNSVNLVAGGPGSGKTIFALEFLYNGIKDFNENGLYITFEEKKENIYEDVKNFKWDLKKYEDEKKFVFLEYTPEQVKKLLVEGGGAIESIIEKNKIKRIVIDSITSFGLLYQDELAKKESALALFELISKWDATAVLTSQGIGPLNDNMGEDVLSFETDSIIILYFLKTGKGTRSRALEILKMRGTKHIEGILELKIRNNGIEVAKTRLKS